MSVELLLLLPCEFFDLLGWNRRLQKPRCSVVVVFTVVSVVAVGVFVVLLTAADVSVELAVFEYDGVVVDVRSMLVSLFTAPLVEAFAFTAPVAVVDDVLFQVSPLPFADESIGVRSSGFVASAELNEL